MCHYFIKWINPPTPRLYSPYYLRTIKLASITSCRAVAKFRAAILGASIIYASFLILMGSPNFSKQRDLLQVLAAFNMDAFFLTPARWYATTSSAR